MNSQSDDDKPFTIIYQSIRGYRSYEYPSKAVAHHCFEEMWRFGTKGVLGFFHWKAPSLPYDAMILLNAQGRVVMERETGWSRLRRFLAGGDRT